MAKFPIFLLCLSAFPVWGQISKEVTLTLVEEAGFNDFKIDLSTNIGDSDDNTELSGTMVAKINLFPAEITTDEFTILSADVEGSDIELSGGGFAANYDFTGEDLGFSAITSTPPGTVDFTTGEFDASQHEVTINQGMLSGRAGSLITGYQDVEFDFSVDNFTGQGDGTGTVTITQGRVEDRKFYFDISVELPTSIDQVVPIDIPLITAEIKVEGTVKAVGETFIEIPDYATWATDTNVAVATTSEDNFDLTPSNPNFILFALGFDRESAPTQLFDFSPSGATLKVNGIFAAGGIEIQWSDDLDTWDRVPDASMVNGKSSFDFGDPISDIITVSKVGMKKFLRVSTVTQN